MLYDSSDPFELKLKSKIEVQRVSWTVTDMDVDPNEQFLIYSSIDPYVRLVDLATLRGKQEFLYLGRESDEEGYGGG